MTAPLRELADAGLCETARLIAELVRRVEGLEKEARGQYLWRAVHEATMREVEHELWETPE